jgi:hypothetical protein
VPTWVACSACGHSEQIGLPADASFPVDCPKCGKRTAFHPIPCPVCQKLIGWDPNAPPTHCPACKAPLDKKDGEGP